MSYLKEICKMLGIIEEYEPTELKEVKWTETKTNEHKKYRETLVWPGGAEKTIEFVAWPSSHRDYRLDENREPVIRIEQAPAYRENKEEIGVYTEEKTIPKTAWVEEIPPGVEATGKTKTVYEQ